MKSLKADSKPRISLEPTFEKTDAPDAVKLSCAYYLKLMAWQIAVLTVWLGRDLRDKWTARRCGILMPRQNGKSSVIIVREIIGLLVFGEVIIHTAHLQTTSRAHFEALCDVLEHPDLKPFVKHIVYSVGRERIVMTNGASIRFMTRSRGSARGLSADLLVCDEAQEMTDEQLEALMPVLSAAPLGNPQTIFAGTPPNENASGEVFGRMREDAIRGDDKSLSWHEWSVGEVGDINDRERWAMANPSLGVLLSEATVETECAQMSVEGFARERLAYWSVFTAKSAISGEAWSKLATSNPPEEGVIAYGVKFSSTSQAVSLAVCLKSGEEECHVELIDVYDISLGVSKLTAWLADRWKKCSLIALDGMQGAPMLEQALRNAGVGKKSIHIMNARDAVMASSMFVDAVNSSTLTHFDQEQLTQAVIRAKKRRIGAHGGYGFASIDEGDISPFEAAVIAHWAARTSKRNPAHEQKIRY